MAPPKRKRDDDRHSRPSPHRPQNLALAQHGQQNNSPRGGGNGGIGGGGGRRQSRNGGRGGSSVPQSPVVSHPAPNAMGAPTNPFQPGRQAQAAPSAPASAERPSTPSALRDVPESNEFLTPERVAHWNTDARNAVVQAAVTAQRNGDALTLAVVFHEIIEASMDQLLGAGELGSLVRDIVAAPAHDSIDTVSTFLDTLSSLTQDDGKQALVRQMLVATDIDVARMRSELENDLLKTLGLVRDSFSKMAVRKATHALYRQSNYNLLREETEGYAKLMTEYFTTVHSEPPSHEAVSEIYQRVNALIGAFDLDIGRVLDVTLDVFANLLVRHGKFFVKFLRVTAWWPELRGLDGIEWQEADVPTLPQWALPDSALWYYTDEEKETHLHLREDRDRKFWKRIGELGDRAGIQAFFELGGRRITANNRPSQLMPPVEGTPLTKQQAARMWVDDWMEQTKTLPPSGNEIAAQLLGFKLRFYASDARDKSDTLPDNLIYLAALLIKIGFISILDLYPHLYPLEENMNAHKERLLQAKKERERKEKGGVANALTMAGALPDDTLPPAISRLRDAESKSKPESERSTPGRTDEGADPKDALPEPTDQKFQLLQSLLCIGALPEALFILGRHPWLLEVYPELLDLIFRLAHHSLNKVYEDARPASSDNSEPITKGAGLRTSLRPSDYIPRRTLRWAKPDQRDAGDGIDYKFYWEDWMDNVPVCQEVGDVIKLCNTFLGLVGPECGKDVVLLTKIVRIGKKSLSDDQSDENRKRWTDFSATFIAPALSFTGRNPGIVNEVWDLLKQFNTATRYTIYQQWFSGNKPAIRAAFAEVQSQTKHELSRVSATNTKEYGRKLAKISYSSPGIVFKLTVKQLVAYPNMIDALVECSRYLTLLGYDCLTWTLVNFFLNPDKGSTQDDGMLSAPWLKNIASFVGKAYQKYNLMDPVPVLQYTASQLLQSEGELYMLDVLEQMIKSMGGIGVSSSVSESMVLALCAGPVLRTYTLQHHLSDYRHQAGSSARRLVKCLKDTGLAPQLLIALAQHVEAYPHRSDQQDTPDKVVLFNIDKLRSNLAQYLELLRSYLSANEFDSLFPPLIEMVADFGVEPDVAFTVARASITAKANAFRAEQRTGSLQTKAKTSDDVTMEESLDLAEQSTAAPSIDVEMKDAAPSTSQDVISSEVVLPDTPNGEIEKLAEQLRSSIPEIFAKHPCVPFYVTFWQLSLADVDSNGMAQQYQKTITAFERQIPAPIPERRGYKPNAPRKDSEETRRVKLEIEKLKLEKATVSQAGLTTQSHLQNEMRHWFDGVPMLDSRSDALHNALLQDCFLPRSRMSLQDAQFAAAMLNFMHKTGTPGFRTIKLLDLLFTVNKLSCIISMYTEDESRAFGRFLNGVLCELQVWHDNKNDAFVRCAHGAKKDLPGFGKRFDADRTATDFLSYTEFCSLLYKWHKALYTALKTCIDSGNWMQIRNSVNVLKALHPVFPRVDVMATDLQHTVTQLAEADARQDLKTSLLSILGDLNKSKKYWQTDYDFRQIPAPAAPVNGHDKAVTENAKLSSEASTPKLKPTAPAFKPRNETNGVHETLPVSRDESASKRVVSTPATPALPSRDREVSKNLDDRASTPSQLETWAPARLSTKPGPPMHPSSVPPRPDGRSTPTHSNSNTRASHALPSRPDSQPPRNRQPERPNIDRPLEHGTHHRYDNRAPTNEYGRLDRPGEPVRQRESSPGRRPRPVPGGRTPERMPPGVEHREWPGRDPREYDDRAMRAPPRDIRAPPVRPPPVWDPRDNRDPRDQRDRPDSRGHIAQNSMESRRMQPAVSMAHDHATPRRDGPPPYRQGGERGDGLQQTPRSSTPVAAAAAGEGPTVDPARAALINQTEQHGLPESSRQDRDSRRDRGSRPQSPRRGDDRRGEERRGNERQIEDRPPPGYHGRHEAPRDHREERGPTQGPLSNNRDRRNETTASTPTGPRIDRIEPSASSRASREMFQPTQGSRPSGHQVQDPNYGRLNQPSEPIPPSGPRSDRSHGQSQPSTPTAPTGPSAPVGIHPSRLENIQSQGPNGPPLQTNMSNPPSGPRGSGRMPQGHMPSSPVGRVPGPPTGPAVNDRGPRNVGNPLRAINSVLTQNTPSDRMSERGAPPPSNPAVRGRGSTRANGSMDTPGGISSPMPPPSYNTTQISRPDGQQSRNTRLDAGPSHLEPGYQEETRSDSRGHRESRRSERSGHERSSDRRPDDRSTRNAPVDRLGPPEEDRGSDRDRREKRGSDREPSRRDREREGGERTSRDPERTAREPRDPSRRERGSRDDGRTSGREERDRRSRPSGGSSSGTAGASGPEDVRKRGRESTDQGQPHGEVKRRR
ncbi:hypothetical protein T440DRAFT_514987 [Plenodomus tracheiphilus IPT5]|uniref:THO complex subunit 2 n=1 Tax=Plenodomus tracheiphilus IPT5 TaxID=1408161 RepID=A0A6A7BFS9_9PLEO|nr:hypothetical protein T440DRAFT_514987 [Plenodomus tracheiphilus IPT5]